MKTTTMRGETIDMGRLMAQHSHQRALGNAKMNARGDILATNGAVAIPREEVAREYHKKNPKAVKQVALRDIRTEAVQFNSPQEAVAKHREAAKDMKKTRKIVDKD